MIPAIANILIIAASTSGITSEQIFPLHPLHNHSSSITELPNGDLLAAWYRGTGEGGADDVQILGARKSQSQSGWSEPFVLADSQDLPDLNPVLFVDPRERLWLFYSTYLDNDITGVLIQYCVASHTGVEGAPGWDRQGVLHCRPKNFAESYGGLLEEIAVERAAELVSNPKLRTIFDRQGELAQTKLGQRLGWMTRTPPVMVGAGRMMIGLYHDAFACSITAYTDDDGATWGFSEPIQATLLGCIQPAIARRNDGTLIALMRDNGKPKQIRESSSTDRGETWSRVTPIDIPNPGSSVASVALKSGSWLLVCNDLPKGRHRLTAYLSDDEGTTWPIRRVLDEIPEGAGELHYPTLIQSGDGHVHLTYTYTLAHPTRRERIQHATFSEASLRESTAGN